MWTNLTLSLILAALVNSPVNAAEAGDIYTIFLVRHAEKMVDGSSNPPLSACGKHRASEMAQIFRSIELGGIYSSDYTRTITTARPIAEEKQLEIHYYDPRNLGEVANILTQRKRDALVVGHSNTTAVLAGMLVGQELDAFDESIYDRIYQVVISDLDSRLYILHQAFECHLTGNT